MAVHCVDRAALVLGQRGACFAECGKFVLVFFDIGFIQCFEEELLVVGDGFGIITGDTAV